MALLYNSRFRVETAAGLPINGGKVRIYDAGTTNLTAVYTDAGLGTPLANPVVAGSDGWTAQIHAVEGTLVDMQTETAAGLILKTYEDVAFVGAATGTLTRDFTNSRLRIAGSAGIVSVEAGDPSGDDTGGQMRLGGYSGTQGNSLSLDFAAISTTGPLKDTGKKLQGNIQSDAVPFAAAATVDIPLTQSPTGVRAWDIDVFDLTVTTGQPNMLARFSYDSGATYKAGASDYEYSITWINTAALAYAQGTSTSIQIAEVVGAPAGKPGMFRIRVITPNSGTDATRLECRSSFFDGTHGTHNDAAGWGLGSYGRATHLRLLPSSSTISGAYRVTALRGFGEA